MGSPKGNCIANADLNWSNKELIAKGKFGCVYRTDWYTYDEEGNEVDRTVAVKCPSKVKKETIFAERDIKSQLSHPNIVNILGFAQLNHKIVLVFEYTEEGTLYDYIWDRREEGGETAETMMRIACEIAKGMEYLHDKSYIHGDLALHNCIVDADGTVKIGDLGLYDDENKSCYFSDSMGNGSIPCPIRWMAPENLPYKYKKPPKMIRKRHTKSYKGDVWAFGVVLYELWTRAEFPFEGCDNDQEVCKHVLNGGNAATWNSRINMRSSMKKLMEDCWKLNPNQRPTFSSIASDIENFLGVEFEDSDECEDSGEHGHSDECQDPDGPDDLDCDDNDYGDVYDDGIDYDDMDLTELEPEYYYFY